MFLEKSSVLRIINPSEHRHIKLPNILLKKYEICIYECICMKFGMKIHDKSVERELHTHTQMYMHASSYCSVPTSRTT